MTKMNWPTVGLITVLAAVAVALAVLTDWTSAEILGLLGLLAGIGGGAAVVGNVAGRVDQVAQETAAQTSQLTTIERQTNGLSERERQDIAERAAAAVLRQQGGR
jgi:phage-related minor tail protein